MIVTGWRVAIELTLSTATFGLLVAGMIWWRTGVFDIFPGTDPLLKQLVFFGVMLGGLFALMCLMARQRIALDAETRTLSVSSINTGFRWRTWQISDIVSVEYLSSSKSIARLVLNGAAGTRPLAILEDSMFATGPSSFFKKIARFVRAHNSNANIAAALTDSSA